MLYSLQHHTCCYHAEFVSLLTYKQMNHFNSKRKKSRKKNIDKSYKLNLSEISI